MARWLVVFLASSVAWAQGVRFAPEEIVLTTGQVTLPTSMCGQFVVEAMIDGQGPYTLVVDTGAGITVLDLTVAEALRTGRDSGIQLRGGSGEAVQAQQIVPIERLAIGGFEARRFDALAIDLSALRFAFGEEFDGILGFPAFAGVLLTLDWPAGEIRVSREALAAGEGVLADVSSPIDWRPIVSIEVDGVERSFLIDSGSSEAFGVLPAWQLAMADGPVVTSATQTVGALSMFKSVRLAGEVALGGVTFESPVATVVEAKEGLIGTQVLGSFVASFDQLAGLVLVERGPATEQRVRPDGPWDMGFVLGPQDGELVVVMIPEGSAGVLREGDVIVSVNGVPAADLRCGRLREILGEPATTVVVERDGERIEAVLPVRRALP